MSWLRHHLERKYSAFPFQYFNANFLSIKFNTGDVLTSFSGDDKPTILTFGPNEKLYIEIKDGKICKVILGDSYSLRDNQFKHYTVFSTIS